MNFHYLGALVTNAFHSFLYQRPLWMSTVSGWHHPLFSDAWSSFYTAGDSTMPGEHSLGYTIPANSHSANPASLPRDQGLGSHQVTKSVFWSCWKCRGSLVLVSRATARTLGGQWATSSFIRLQSKTGREFSLGFYFIKVIKKGLGVAEMGEGTKFS